jgi:uncharacterized protein (TIGR00730 family)
MMMKRICIFCGSSSGSRPEYRAVAEELARALAQRGLGLVFGGGGIGLMNVVADAGLELGIEIIGVIPGALVAKELAHRGLSDMRVVGSMHERKALMAELADAFVALPGGFGTLEEFCEVLTWAQLGLHRKPCGLLNVAGYYDPLLAFFDHALAERFLRPEHRAMVLVDSNPDWLLDRLAVFQPPDLDKWIQPELSSPLALDGRGVRGEGT